jgi:hypothetical protein
MPHATGAALATEVEDENSCGGASGGEDGKGGRWAKDWVGDGKRSEVEMVEGGSPCCCSTGRCGELALDDEGDDEVRWRFGESD